MELGPHKVEVDKLLTNKPIFEGKDDYSSVFILCKGIKE